MNEIKYVEQLSEIKKIISERSRFNALSGISGIMAGSYALIGALLVYYKLYSQENPIVYDINNGFSNDLAYLLVVALTVMLASIMTGFYFSMKKARQNNEPFFTPVVKKLLINFSFFMTTAALVLLATYLKGFYVLLAPLCLIFYGLTLVNLSAFINTEVKNLGYCITLIGSIALFFSEYGLLLWAMGFGVMHIIYGFVMWYKYDRK